MAFGLSDTGKAAADEFIAVAPGLIASLQTAGMTTEADLMQRLHATVSDAISQEQDAIAVDLKPVVEQFAAFNANVATLIGLLQSLKDDGVPYSGILFGGKKS